MNVEGYHRVLSSYSVKHILQEHGEAANEAGRGQIPVTKEDIARIPEIVESYDSAINAGKSASGLDTIRYTKRINGDVYYFEEARTGKKELVPVTMYIKKVKK